MSMSERPNPIAAADLLRSVIECWRELDGELDRNSGGGSRGKSEGAVPLDLDVVDAMRAIDLFARTYCHMLMDDTDWSPKALNTGALIQGLIDRIGHFTHSDDPMVAYEFIEDLEKIHRKSWAVARPDGRVKIPIGPCFADECPGTLNVTVDRERSTESASLALWRPMAMCYLKGSDGKALANPEHQIDAKLYAAEKARHADEEEVTHV